MHLKKMLQNLLVTLLGAGLMMISGCYSDTEPVPEQSVVQQEPLRFSANPINAEKLLPLTSKPAVEMEEAADLLKSQLNVLAEYAKEVRTQSGQPTLPRILAPQFETTFVERDKLRASYIGERIRIARWLPDDKTPTYYEGVALYRLFNGMMKSWSKAERFRIDFQIHTINNRPNYFDAEVRVDVRGDVESPTSRLSGDETQLGRASTGLWKIVWVKGKPGAEPRIKSIDVLAYEETINYIGGGVMFRDCTRSVLRNDDELRDKLSYGLDAWGKQIPHLDVSGNCGLAIGDVNGDGLDDVYVCQPHGLANLLLVQNPDGTADNVASKSGVDVYDQSSCALIIDINNDRLQDLVVATDSRLVLYSNSGNGKFQVEYKLKIGHGTESLSAIDYDQDGDLDLYLTKYRPVSRFDDVFAQPKSRMAAINGGRNVLLRNDEVWQFKDVTAEVGLVQKNSHYTRAAIWSDYDADGDLDLYHVNEYFPDVLFENRNGWFNETAKSEMIENAANNTTVSIGDFDHDGRPDFFVGANAGFDGRRITQEYIQTGGNHPVEAKGFAAPNRVLHSDSAGALKQFELQPPILSSESSFSSVVADFNNDSWEDVAVTNGWLSRERNEKAGPLYYRSMFDSKRESETTSLKFDTQHEISDLFRMGDSFDGHQRNACFLTIGPLRLTNYTNSSGLDFLDDGRGIGATDWDGDGDVDLVINNRTAPRLRVLRNVYSSANSFLKIRLAGTTSNRDAIGAKVQVHLRGSKQPLVKMLTAGSGRSSQSSKEMHFGLGKGTGVEKISVTWPDGSTQEFRDVAIGKTYRIVEGKSELREYTIDRYRIALDLNPIVGIDGLPLVERLPFFPTSRLPILQYRTEGNDRARWYQVQNIENRPLLCVFCPNLQDNTELLRELNSRDRDLQDLDTDLLVAFTGNLNDEDIYVTESARQIDEVGFKFRWGVLSKSSNDKLAQTMGQWFYDQNLPNTPMAFLLDGDSNVHFGYREEQLNWDNIAKDLRKVADGNFVLNGIPERAGTNWVLQRRTPRFDRLQMRFKEVGYVRDANDFKEMLGAQHSEDYLNRAIDLASKGKLSSAVTAAERSVELDKSSVQSLVGLAEVSREFASTSDSQTRRRLLSSAGEHLDQALEIEPNNVDAILARAEIFRLEQDIENALQLLLKYLKNEPEAWNVHANIGRLFVYKQDYFQATQYLVNAIENRPTLPNVAADLGYIYLLNEEFSDAKAYLELGMRLQPSDQDLRRNLAEAEFWLGNYESAGRLFEEIVKSQPTMSHPKQVLAWLKATSPQSSFRDGQGGLSIIRPFIELKDESSPISLEIMAACLAEVGEFDEALSVQRQALEVIEEKTSLERYSEEQLAGLRDRVELYKRQRPYRAKEPGESPLRLLGVK